MLGLGLEPIGRSCYNQLSIPAQTILPQTYKCRNSGLRLTAQLNRKKLQEAGKVLTERRMRNEYAEFFKPRTTGRKQNKFAIFIPSEVKICLDWDSNPAYPFTYHFTLLLLVAIKNSGTA